MDPNATLELIRELTRGHNDGTWLDDAQIDELVEAIGRLDEWLTSGGFKPDDWKRNT